MYALDKISFGFSPGEAVTSAARYHPKRELAGLQPIVSLKNPIQHLSRATWDLRRLKEKETS